VKPYVALALTAALLFAWGNALQKHGLASRLPPLPLRTVARPLWLLRALVRNPPWLLGLALTFVAVGLETQALAIGDVSVVKPLSRVQSVFVIAIGVGVLGERLARTAWLGVAGILAGGFLLALAPADEIPYAPSAAARLMAGLGVGSLVAIVLAVGRGRRDARGGEVRLAFASGLLFGLGDAMMKTGTEAVRTTLGGFDLASAPTLAALLATPGFHLSLAATAAAFVLQQVAFSRGRVSVSAPVIGVGGARVAGGGGAALLRESVTATRVMGVAMVAAGTLLLGGREERAPRLADTRESTGRSRWS